MEAEERDVVHHELCRFLSASCTSEEEVLSVRAVFGKTPGVPRYGDHPPCTEKSLLSSCRSCLCLQTLQVSDAPMPASGE